MYFGRLLTAMVTPFDENGALNIPAAKELVEHLIQTGSDGIVVAGTTGESPQLSAEEKDELLKAVIEQAAGRVSIVMGTGTNSTAHSIENTRRAEELGADGVMLVVPYYNKPPQEALYQHFKAVAESTKLPVILYNVPGRTSRNLEPATVERLSQIENIVALKEAAGDLEQMSLLKKLLPADFQIYSGDDSLTLPMLSLGATGVISVASHVDGKDIKAMIEAFLAGENEKALSLHLKLYRLFKDLFCTTNPIPVKAAVNMLGIAAGPLRLPLIEATEAEKAKVRACMEELGVL